ncbi:uncharacterized protein LOC128041709 [Gossypium raimondii]|uniref:uncharacterized protein LOC128041709 n=1 Tax=Gossypium raimondii TaxID=29730 RepID=UPI00227C77B1|nr:uncharacterized protein LOC128041709 [Gossypium raimondii]
MKVDKHLFRALAQFWNPTYSCFTFGKVDLVSIVEEYMALLRFSKIQVDRVYSKVWVAARIKQKGNSKCIPWKNLKDLILAQPDTKKRVDVFALSIYGLVVFPKALGYIDEAVTDLFDRLDRSVTPVPVILVETFRSLNACRKAGEGRFIGCAQLLLTWFHRHFWKVDKVSYRVFSKNYSPLKELAATPMRDDVSEEKWMAILQNLQEDDIEWRPPWLLPDEVLQYRSRKFVSATQGLAECEFSYKDDGYKKKVREMSSTWNQTRRMKSLAVGLMTTHEYNEWWVKRINDNVPRPSLENSQSIEEHLHVSSKLEIIKQDFERRNVELEKKIEQMEEEKMNLRLDVDVQKLEVEKLRKGKNKAKEDLDDLKMDYKKLRLLMRTDGLGKTSEQWREETREERNKSNRWERKLQEVQARNKVLEESLLENQIEKGELKNRVGELERSLRQYRS